jgi:hypothetical protein
MESINENYNKDISNHRVSVLKNMHDGKSPKQVNQKPIAWVFLVLCLMMAILADLSVFLLSIPEFDELQVYEGEMTMTKGGKRNMYLALDTRDKVVNFTCWITSDGISNCLNKEQWSLYEGKNGKVYFYRAMINGFFHENRLLQLETDGVIVITYQEQKSRYLRSKHTHVYVKSLLLIPISIWLLALYLSNNIKGRKGES